jgi:hypothetical protein
MKILGDIILGFAIIAVGAALLAAQFACTINNALEKHQKENEKENEDQI